MFIKLWLFMDDRGFENTVHGCAGKLAPEIVRVVVRVHRWWNKWFPLEILNNRRLTCI